MVKKKKSRSKVTGKNSRRKNAMRLYDNDDKTQISISLPRLLVKRIEAAAALKNRNRSNYIANELLNAVERDGH